MFAVLKPFLKTNLVLIHFCIKYKELCPWTGTIWNYWLETKCISLVLFLRHDLLTQCISNLIEGSKDVRSFKRLCLELVSFSISWWYAFGLIIWKQRIRIFGNFIYLIKIRCMTEMIWTWRIFRIFTSFSHYFEPVKKPDRDKNNACRLTEWMSCVHAYGGNENSCNVCSQSSLHHQGAPSCKGSM